MLCEKCRQREATVYKQVVINGVAHSEHLCAECAAQERGGKSPFASFFHNDMLTDGFFAPFMGMAPAFARDFAPFFQMSGRTSNDALSQQEAEQGIGHCPACGMSWEAFERNGFLGCETCYDHFKDALPPLMQTLHSGDAEPVVAEETAEDEPGLSAKEHLQAELARAIAAERFEEAAQLRDAIKALEAAENGGKEA